jgi:hypothetical protein
MISTCCPRAPRRPFLSAPPSAPPAPAPALRCPSARHSTHRRGAHAPRTLRTTRSPTLMTRRHAICHTPQLTAPRGAKGSASHHAAGPSQPGGRKKTGVDRYHHPSANCAPVVAAQSAVLNLSAYLVRADEISLSGGVRQHGDRGARLGAGTHSASPGPRGPYPRSGGAWPTSRTGPARSSAAAPSSCGGRRP